MGTTAMEMNSVLNAVCGWRHTNIPVKLFSAPQLKHKSRQKFSPWAWPGSAVHSLQAAIRVCKEGCGTLSPPPLCSCLMGSSGVGAASIRCTCWANKGMLIKAAKPFPKCRNPRGATGSAPLCRGLPKRKKKTQQQAWVQMEKEIREFVELIVWAQQSKWHVLFSKEQLQYLEQKFSLLRPNLGRSLKLWRV